MVCLLVFNFTFSHAQEKGPPAAKGQAAAAAAEARSEGAQSGAKLPVKRVVLYKNGVGYFEHLGSVRGNQDVHIDFTSAQLNDVLKSLTVLDLAGGRITSVDYNSEAPLARRLATLRLALGEKPSVSEFLGALRGARVEVHGASGTPLTGKLLSVERKTRLKDRITLRKNQSALVPIAQTEIEAEKVSIWSGTTALGRPLRGLWLTNTSALTLDAGSFSVLENEVFAGEGLTDPIKPGERRIVSYATDLGLLVETQRNNQPQHVTRVKISKGMMTQTSELRERTLHTVRNQENTPQILVIEHPARTDWKLALGAKEPDERSSGTYRFRL